MSDPQDDERTETSLEECIERWGLSDADIAGLMY